MSLELSGEITAIATAVMAFLTLPLVGGVAVAVASYRAQVRDARIVETGSLISLWRDDMMWISFSYADKDTDHEKNRRFAVRFYRHIVGMKNRRRRFYRKVDNIIQKMSALAERTEIYIRKHVADEAILIEHLGYDVVASYYHYQDILRERAATDNLDYEGWRHLAMRVQDYAKLHPRLATLAPSLVEPDFPPSHYKDGQVSDPPKRLWLRAMRLRFVKPSSTSEA